MVNKTSGEETLIGDAQVVSKKKKTKRGGGMGPPLLRWGPGIYPIKLILVRVIVTGAMVAEVNSICFHSALVSSRKLPEECPLRWKPPIKMAKMP